MIAQYKKITQLTIGKTCLGVYYDEATVCIVDAYLCTGMSNTLARVMAMLRHIQCHPRKIDKCSAISFPA